MASGVPAGCFHTGDQETGSHHGRVLAAGAITMAAGIGVWACIFGGSPHAAAVSAKTSIQAVGPVAKSGWSALGALLWAISNALIEFLIKCSHGIAAFLIVDVLVLLLASVIWRKRRMLAGPYSILP